MSEGSTQPVGRPRSELALRVASGLVMAALALGTAWSGGWAFGTLWSVAAVLLLREWLSLVGIAGHRLTVVWALGAVAVVIAGALAEAMPLVAPEALVAALGGALVAGLASPGGRRGWAALGTLVAAVVVVVPVDVRGHPAHSLVAILWLYAVVWLSDIGAFFAGRAIGGPKLWPRVSPKKTWSGAVGGLLVGTASAVAIVLVARSRFGIGWFDGWQLVALSAFASVVSMGGDLAESAMKRHFDVKDSSHLIPGHGGVMDRLDSFWAVCMLLAVIVYVTGGPG
ncbi:phosphatidate cytidylyltransferase [Alsobacter sp. R-9]